MTDRDVDPMTESSDPTAGMSHDSNGNVMTGNPAHPVPRLCHLRRWEGLSYGFNLISRKGRTGHFIDSIEYGLAAYYSGLKNGDRVVEIDGVRVSEIPHGDVVKLIKDSGKDGVKMLVVDQKTEDYFKSKGYTITSASNNYQVKFLASPVERPADVIEEPEQVKMREQPRKKSSIFKRFSTPEPPPPLAMDAILPVETVYATLGTPDDLNSSLNRPSIRPKVPAVAEMRSDVVRAKTSSSSNHNSLKNGRPGHKAHKAVIPGTNSLQSKLRRMSSGKTAPRARLCHLSKSHRETYGFILRTYHDTLEKMILKLDPNGIAARTGVKDMDFLVEVDGINVMKENHSQVTNRIKAATEEISLLLISPEDMVWFRRNSMVPKAAEAKVLKTPSSSGARPKSQVRDDGVQLRTGSTGSFPARNLNNSDERSSTQLEEFQLSEYNSRQIEEERQKLEEKKRVSQERKVTEAAEQKRQERESRQQQEEERQREADERTRQQQEAEKQTQDEERERNAQQAEEEANNQDQQRIESSKPESQPSPPEPAPRKASMARAISVHEVKEETSDANRQEEEQQANEEETEVNGGLEEEDEGLKQNLNVSVAEIKRRLAADAEKKKNSSRKRGVREKAI